MQELEAINYLEKLEIGNFLTVNFPVTNTISIPMLVRPKEDGTYELISGHRRKRACELAGIRQVKAIVREMTDEEATIQMGW